MLALRLRSVSQVLAGRPPVGLPAIAGVLLLFAACGSSRTDPSLPTAPVDDAGTSSGGDGDAAAATDGAAPSDAPAGCILPAPTFDHDVLPILQARCSSCHTLDAGQWPLIAYDDVVDWEALLYADLTNGTMPPLDAGALSSEERFTMLDWIACGLVEK